MDQDGIYVVGEYLGMRLRRERSWTGKDGSTHVEKGADIRILVGTSVVTVQYSSTEEAAAVVARTEARERIAVRVSNRYGVKDGEAWQFYAGWAPVP